MGKVTTYHSLRYRTGPEIDLNPHVKEKENLWGGIGSKDSRNEKRDGKGSWTPY